MKLKYIFLFWVFVFVAGCTVGGVNPQVPWHEKYGATEAVIVQDPVTGEVRTEYVQTENSEKFLDWTMVALAALGATGLSGGVGLVSNKLKKRKEALLAQSATANGADKGKSHEKGDDGQAV